MAKKYDWILEYFREFEFLLFKYMYIFKTPKSNILN